VAKRLGPAILIVGLLSCLSAVAVAGGASIGFPPQINFRFNAHFSPVKLSKGQWTSAGVRIDAKVSMEDGSHPPALQELVLELDKNIAIDATGLPVCRPLPQEDSDIRSVETVCKDARVGAGRAEFEVAFPEQLPFSVSSEVLVFNAGIAGGKAKLILYAYLAAPISAAAVIPVEVHRASRGRFGLEAVAKVPKVAGGYGSITSLSLSLRRKFTYKGRLRSYLLAKCPDDQLFAKGTGILSDGSSLAGSLVRRCTSTS
jgi:hypothetical protein